MMVNMIQDTLEIFLPFLRVLIQKSVYKPQYPVMAVMNNIPLKINRTSWTVEPNQK